MTVLDRYYKHSGLPFRLLLSYTSQGQSLAIYAGPKVLRQGQLQQYFLLRNQTATLAEPLNSLPQALKALHRYQQSAPAKRQTCFEVLRQRQSKTPQMPNGPA